MGLLIVLGASFVLGPASLAERLRLITAGVCALQSSHMIHLGTTPLPFCARNTGIFVGLAVGYVALFGRGDAFRWPSPRIALGMAGLLTLMGLDGLNALLSDLALPHPYPPDNLLRLATGLLAGAAMAVFVLPVTGFLLDLHSSGSAPRAMSSGLLPVALTVALAAMASGWPILWLPTALVSVASLVGTTALINLWALARLLHRSGHASLFLVGLLAAVAELLLLSLARLAVMPIA